jgi:N4-gp56 family major capsid protein
MGRVYNDPIGGSESQIGTQLSEFFYQKKALIEARREQYFMQLADVTAMPKHMGKTIKRFHYIPLLDDENINDEGLDAAGAILVQGGWTAYDANGDEVTGGVGWTAATATTAGYYDTETNARGAAGAVSAVQNGGNLYGSSKDVGSISGKLPALTENGGRVNRVGFKRKELEGSIEKFGFFDEYTQESLDFDSDAQLKMHINREMVNGASEITEDALQIDLLNAAGVLRYAGDATQDSDVDDADEVTYGDLMRLAIDLDNNRTPKHTTVITGTRMIDTKTIPACRVMYIGSELQPLIEAMVDLHGERAFIPVQKYAAAGTTLRGEWGTVGNFRLVVVPEMLKWAGAGADASGTSTHHETGDQYDIFPMLVVGDQSFTTIGFQTSGKTVKFKITHKAPGRETADRTDPYGETGFMSIKWYYGFMALRPERIALVKTAAPL